MGSSPATACCCPPGNGKTSVAEAVASELMLPFYAIRYEGVVSSFLGETAALIVHAFDAMIAQGLAAGQLVALCAARRLDR